MRGSDCPNDREIWTVEFGLDGSHALVQLSDWAESSGAVGLKSEEQCYWFGLSLTEN